MRPAPCLRRVALEEDRSVYDLVLERGLLSREELDRLLDPETMLAPHRTKGS